MVSPNQEQGMVLKGEQGEVKGVIKKKSSPSVWLSHDNIGTDSYDYYY